MKTKFIDTINLSTRIIICAAVFGVFNAVMGQTLDEYLKIAADNNPGLKARYAEYEASLQQIAQARGLPDPSLSVSAFGQMVETRVGQQMTQLSIEQMFPWFGTLKAKGDVAALKAEAGLANFNEARNELFYKVREAYFSLYELDQIIEFQKKNLAIMNTYHTLATSRFEQGKGAMVDVIRVSIMTNERKTEINILERERNARVIAFNRLLNRADNDTMVIDETPAEPEDSNYRVDSVFSNNPRLRQLEQQRLAAVAGEKVARKESMPMLGIGFNYVVVDERMDVDIPDNGKDAYMPMLTVTLPVYRKKYKAMASEARLMATAYQHMKQDVVNELASMHAMTLNELDQAKARITLYDSQAEQTQQAIDLLLTAVSNAGADFEEVLAMQQELLRYEIEKVGALTDYHQAAARLIYLSGSQQNQSK